MCSSWALLLFFHVLVFLDIFEITRAYKSSTLQCTTTQGGSHQCVEYCCFYSTNFTNHSDYNNHLTDSIVETCPDDEFNQLYPQGRVALSPTCLYDLEGTSLLVPNSRALCCCFDGERPCVQQEPFKFVKADLSRRIPPTEVPFATTPKQPSPSTMQTGIAAATEITYVGVPTMAEANFPIVPPVTEAPPNMPDSATPIPLPPILSQPFPSIPIPSANAPPMMPMASPVTPAYPFIPQNTTKSVEERRVIPSLNEPADGPKKRLVLGTCNFAVDLGERHESGKTDFTYTVKCSTETNGPVRQLLDMLLNADDGKMSETPSESVQPPLSESPPTAPTKYNRLEETAIRRIPEFEKVHYENSILRPHRYSPRGGYSSIQDTT